MRQKLVSGIDFHGDEKTKRDIDMPMSFVSSPHLVTFFFFFFEKHIWLLINIISDGVCVYIYIYIYSEFIKVGQLS